MNFSSGREIKLLGKVKESGPVRMDRPRLTERESRGVAAPALKGRIK